MSPSATLNQSETMPSSAALAPNGIFRETPEGKELDLMAVAILLLRGKRAILICAVSALLLTALIVFLLIRPTYTGKAMFDPPQTSPGAGLGQLANQLGSLNALSALGGSGLKSPGDIYVGILGSRTIADDLIKQFDLQQVYRKKKLSDAEEKLKDNSKFVAGKDTLVTISVEDHDPKRAADLANGYLADLRAQNGRLALTEASQRRLFFQQQLESEKNALADAEVDLKKTQEQTGIISPNDQSRAVIGAIEQTHAQITAREVELSSLQQSTTEQNPEVIRLQAQISNLRQQLQKLENGREEQQPGNVQFPTAKVPELELEYVRTYREVKYHELLFGLIAKQFEAARLEESHEAPVLQVIDYAVVPDKKSGPPRALLLIAGLFAGALIGSAWVLWKHFVRQLKATPGGSARFDALREAIRGR
jgi:capsule polysaccharide export protein KpsE/RkpR